MRREGYVESRVSRKYSRSSAVRKRAPIIRRAMMMGSHSWRRSPNRSDEIRWSFESIFFVKIFFLNNLAIFDNIQRAIPVYIKGRQKNAYTCRNRTNTRQITLRTLRSAREFGLMGERISDKGTLRETGVRWPVNGSRVSNPRFRDVPFMLSDPAKSLQV